MLFRVRIEGDTPLIQHSAEGINPRHPANIEKANITRKKGSNRTAADDARLAELDTIMGFWLDRERRPTVPAAAITACIEGAARKLKQGAQVREGMIVTETAFEYDEGRYGTTLDELGKSTQFTAAVVVQRSRLLRTRPMFELPWAVEFKVDADDELVDKSQLESWLDIAGRRLGLGDWRPAKGGQYGRFHATSVEVVT